MDPTIESQLADLRTAEQEVIEAYGALRKDAPRHVRASATYAVYLTHVGDAVLWSARHCEEKVQQAKASWFIAGLGVGFGIACFVWAWLKSA